jgi:gliotoxin biosynthesis cytochrome P450 monooxygenase
VAVLGDCVVVGLPLSREEEWIQASINYMRDCVAIAYASQKWNSLLRPIAAPFLHEVRKAQGDSKFTRDKMALIVAEVLKEHNSEKSDMTKAGIAGTFVSWLSKHT